MKDKLLSISIIIVMLFLISLPLTMAVGKYQVCKNYFSELTTYVCLFTNLPPYTGLKK